MNTRILVVNAEPTLRDFIEKSLKDEGFAIQTAGSCQEALSLSAESEPDLMIVDLQLPDLKGHAICQRIRESSNVRTVPMLVISGDQTDGWAANCLNSGADGVLSKQADGLELLAHVRALLRRSRIYLWNDDLLQKGQLVIRRAERRVLYDNQELPALTPKEYSVLHELVMNSPNIVDRNQLVKKVWGVTFDELGRKTLDVHIQRIRRKLGPAAHLLKTVSLVGYQWSDSIRPQ